VAEGWLVLAFSTLRCAELQELDEEDWCLSFELARDSARKELSQLVTEASTAEDLVIPDLVDGLVYPARAALVCGYVAAYFLSERCYRDNPQLGEQTRELLLRELEYLQFPGEAGAPFLLMIATALEVLNQPSEAAKLMVIWAAALTKANAPGSKSGAADPYHSISEVLLHSFGANTDLDEEQFSGEAYTLHIALDWLTRRGHRPVLEKLWPAVTRLHFAEFRPSLPLNLLAHDDPDGVHQTWAPPAPASWEKLREEATTVLEEALPARLWQQIGMLPYLPLVYPYRLTRDVAMALDYMATKRCRVALTPD
jgi:hypothetical protein